MDKTEPVGRSSSGFTLMEVMVVVALTALVLVGTVRGIVGVNSLNYASAQHVAAFGLARERYERMRAMDFETIATTNTLLATATVQMTHLGGRLKLPLNATVSNTIANFATPERKHITVTVTWTYQGRVRTERVTGVIYNKRS